MFPNIEISSKDDLNPNKAVKKLPASYSLTNLDFLLPQTLKFDESILPLFFLFSIIDFLLSVSFYTSYNKVTLFYK